MAELCNDYKVVKSERLSRATSKRWVVIDPSTGEILDDAQGYGYRTKQSALAGYGYKLKYLHPHVRYRRRQAFRWLLAHEEFDQKLMEVRFAIASKGKWQNYTVFNQRLVANLLAKYGYKELTFSSKELLAVWESF